MRRRCVRPEYSRGFSYHPLKILLSSRALMFRLFFFSCKDEKITGGIHGHCQDSVSIFPFKSQKTSLCTSSSEQHVCPYMLPAFHHITSHPSSSFLFLLLSFFFQLILVNDGFSKFLVLYAKDTLENKIQKGSRKCHITGLLAEAFSYPFTIIFTYLFVYAFVFLFCFVFTQHFLTASYLFVNLNTLYFAASLITIIIIIQQLLLFCASFNL